MADSPATVKTEGLEKLVDVLGTLVKEAQAKDQKVVSVSYGNEDVLYASYVHEDLTKQHEPPTMAKWLEHTAIVERDMLGNFIAEMVQGGMGVDDALKKAGDLLLYKANLVCPEDTGALKRSGKVEMKG